MQKLFATNCLLLLSNFVFSQYKLVFTDLEIKGVTYVIKNPVNIGNNKGYDNQPFFYNHGNSVLFSTKADSIQTDIFTYDIKQKTKRAFTKNNENEYSPLLSFDKKHITCVKGKEQRLAIYNLDATIEETLFLHPDSIGYYNWIDNETIVAAVLTKPKETLQLINLNSKKCTIIAYDVGRTIVPYMEGFLFVKKKIDSLQNNAIIYVDKHLVQQQLITLAKDKEDFCLHNNALFTTENDILKICRLNSHPIWKDIVNLQTLGIKNVTRLTINEHANRMIFVCMDFILPKE